MSGEWTLRRPQWRIILEGQGAKLELPSYQWRALSSKYLQARHKPVDAQFCTKEGAPQLSLLRLINWLHWLLVIDGTKDVYVPSWLLSPMWTPHHQTDRPSAKITGGHNHYLWYNGRRNASELRKCYVMPLGNSLNLWFSTHHSLLLITFKNLNVR